MVAQKFKGPKTQIRKRGCSRKREDLKVGKKASLEGEQRTAEGNRKWKGEENIAVTNYDGRETSWPVVRERRKREGEWG